MSLDPAEANTANRHKGRECALQMLFAADLTDTGAEAVIDNYWRELGDGAVDMATRDFADRIVAGTLTHLEDIDELIKKRTEHWRIERMALVDRNILRLAVFEFRYCDTPNPVAINEALEVARRFSTYEATQFINGVLDGIRLDIEAAGTAETDSGQPAATQQ